MRNSQLWKPEKLEWTAEDELVANAIGARELYRFHLDFWSQGNFSEYETELGDGELWLEVVAELQAQMISPGVFVRSVVPPARTGFFPQPSQLLYTETIDLFEEKMAATEATDFVIFANELKSMKMAVVTFDETHYEDEDWSEQEMMFHELNEYLDTNQARFYVLECYIIAHDLKIQDLICDESFFLQAVRRYYTRKNVFNQHLGLKRFFEIFDPIARETYLQITDTSGLSFTDLATRL